MLCPQNGAYGLPLPYAEMSLSFQWLPEQLAARSVTNGGWCVKTVAGILSSYTIHMIANIKAFAGIV
jgi:hypothetical protein